jgi:acyl carrier protein
MEPVIPVSNKEILYSAFCESLNISRETLNDDLKYNTVAEWDSVAHMVLISVIENKFGVMLDTNDILDLSSVAQAQAILEKHGVSFS